MVQQALRRPRGADRHGFERHVLSWEVGCAKRIMIGGLDCMIMHLNMLLMGLWEKGTSMRGRLFSRWSIATPSGDQWHPGAGTWYPEEHCCCEEELTFVSALVWAWQDVREWCASPKRRPLHARSTPCMHDLQKLITKMLQTLCEKDNQLFRF